MNTPKDILKYVLDNKLEADFMANIALHKGDYSIGEIADGKFSKRDDSFYFSSKGFNINVEVDDDYVVTGIINELYISSFISRKGQSYQVHFLVHQYPRNMKPQFEENIANEVIQYMILKTIVALRLDTEKKVDDYCRVTSGDGEI